MNNDNQKSKNFNLSIKTNSNKIFHYKSDSNNNKNLNIYDSLTNPSKGDLFFLKKSSNIDKNVKRRIRKSIIGSSIPYDEEIDKINEELELTRRKNNGIDNNKLLYQAEDDLITIEKILKEDNLRYNRGNEISFLDIICFILKKTNKKLQEIELLKIYFLKNEKLVAMFKSLNVSINYMMDKLVDHIKYENKFRENILFKEGDKGDKFYIILKGEVGILIQHERIINCSKIEFIKCLMILYLYQEKSLISKMILANKATLILEDKCIWTLMAIFKFYHFYKKMSDEKIYKNVMDFIHFESKINSFLHKKLDFSPEQCFSTLDLSISLSEELYNFYYRIIDSIQTFFWTEIGNKINKKEVLGYHNNNPNNLSELCLQIKSNEQDRKIYKTEEFLEKLYNINEISNNLIRKCNVNEYIKRSNTEEIIKLIRKDSKNFIMKVYEEKINYKYYKYFEVNQLKDGNIFGELALINPSKKRTATVIINEDCHLGVLNKEGYDISIKNAQDKLRIRTLLFFTNGPIFAGISNNYFLNYLFFRFKKKVYNSGEFLFRRGDLRTKIIFIINGELQLSAKLTLRKLTEIIKYLNNGKLGEDGGISKIYCRDNFKFKKFYEEAIKNLRFYVLKDKEIAGLDDMTENNKFLFDCKCVSLDQTEVYELDYKVFEEASEIHLVRENNNNYVSKKKEILLNRLYDQRESIAKNEYNRIKTFFKNINLAQIFNNEDNNNNDINIKTLNNFFPLNNTTFNKKIFSFSEENNNTYINNNTIYNANNNNNINSKDNYIYKKFPPISTEKLSSYQEMKKKRLKNPNYNDIEEKKVFRKSSQKNSFLLNRENNYLIYNMNKEKKLDNENNKAIKLKSDKTNHNKITRISSYSMKNNNITTFSSPKKSKKSIHHLSTAFSLNQIQKLKKNINKPSSKILMREFTKLYNCPNKTPYDNKRFIFNNQKIFEPLLKNKIRKNNDEKKFINITLKNEISHMNTNKEGLFNEKKNIYNSEIEIVNVDSSYRNKKYTLPFKNQKWKKSKKKMEENYKNIFFIDCLCLDNWEEKKNKTPGKEKAKLRGKKIIQ